MTQQTEEGLPDGMKVDAKGKCLRHGPGGIWIFSPEGKHLGTIKAAGNSGQLQLGRRWPFAVHDGPDWPVSHQAFRGRKESALLTIGANMKRRTCLKAALAAMSAAPVALAADRARKIRLDVDLTVDPSREKEMLKNFHEIFKPAAIKHPGYIDVQIFKLRTVVMGKPPGRCKLPFRPHLSKRRTAAKVGGQRRSQEGLADS